MPDPSQPQPTRPSADPASLFDSDELRTIHVPAAPVPSPAPAPAPVPGGYELEGFEDPGFEEPPRPIPIPAPPIERPKVKARPKPKVEELGPEESGSTEFVTEFSEVDPVWTRMGEWGPDLYRVAGAGFGTLFLFWLLGFGGLGLIVLLLGGAATAYFSYPLLITMERPVRITPEQAVKDFYSAASHHFPSYRRMWLLLSVAGQQSGKFASFEAFRDHWKRQIDRWRSEAGAGKFTPLKFEVDGFRADKSTGQETSRADYTVNVSIRDREDVGTIASFKMAHGLVKGPDRMWYLNRGVLDQASK